MTPKENLQFAHLQSKEIGSSSAKSLVEQIKLTSDSEPVDHIVAAEIASLAAAAPTGEDMQAFINANVIKKYHRH